MSTREEKLATYQHMIGLVAGAKREADAAWANSRAAADVASEAQREYERLSDLLEQARRAFEETFQ